MTPRVTVLLTVYNGLPYLAEAVESMLRQSVGDLELLVIDDGSTDGSSAWLQRCADTRVRLVCNTQNLGQAACLNLGLGLARGEFVARMDQDDVSLPHRLARQLAWLDHDPALAAVGSWVRYIDDQSRPAGATGLRIADRGQFLGALLTFMTPAGHPTMMMRRRAALEVGGYVEADAPCEDYSLWTALALAGHGVRVVPEPLVRLRVHEGQQSQTRSARQRERFEQAHERFVRALLGDRVTPELLALLRGDPSLWDASTSAAAIRGGTARIPELLAAAADATHLSVAEAASLRRHLAWWLLRLAARGAIHQRRVSVHLYAAAWRLGGAWRLPTAWLYPVAMAGWPLYAPSLRRRWLGWAGAAARAAATHRAGGDS